MPQKKGSRTLFRAPLRERDKRVGRVVGGGWRVVEGAAYIEVTYRKTRDTRYDIEDHRKSTERQKAHSRNRKDGETSVLDS